MATTTVSRVAASAAIGSARAAVEAAIAVITAMVATTITDPAVIITPKTVITATSTIVTTVAFAAVMIAIMEAVEAPIITMEAIAMAFTVEAVEAIMIMVMKPAEIVTIMEAVEPEAAIEVKRAVIHRTRVIEVVPGARADKHAVHKPVGAVIAVRRATKRIVGIKTVRADRWRVVYAVSRPNLHANGNLRVRVRYGNNEQSQQSNIL
jgi:hypothetical protein